MRDRPAELPTAVSETPGKLAMRKADGEVRVGESELFD